MDASERRVRARAEAVDWWLHMQPGKFQQEQRKQFVGWLRESPIHVEEMLRVARLHRELARFDRWDEISTEGAVEENVLDFPARVSGSVLQAAFDIDNESASSVLNEEKHWNTTKRWIGAVAATLLVAAVGTLVSMRFNSQEIETQRGERRELALSDGSVVQVDPETVLKVNYDERAREIVLSQGRALFRVAKDPGRPFSVRTEETVVRAIGTAFAVERQHDGVRVTVAEGRVTVFSPELQESGSQATPILSANEQTIIQRSGVAQAVRKVDTSRELAWAEGRLEFNDESLQSAVAQFNRYNSLQLRIVDPDLRTRTVSGIFNASDPKSFVAFLEATTDARADHASRHEIAIDSRH